MLTRTSFVCSISSKISKYPVNYPLKNFYAFIQKFPCWNQITKALISCNLWAPLIISQSMVIQDYTDVISIHANPLVNVGRCIMYDDFLSKNSYHRCSCHQHDSTGGCPATKVIRCNSSYYSTYYTTDIK